MRPVRWKGFSSQLLLEVLRHSQAENRLSVLAAVELPVGFNVARFKWNTVIIRAVSTTITSHRYLNNRGLLTRQPREKSLGCVTGSYVCWLTVIRSPP